MTSGRAELDEDDVALIDALHVGPRASYTAGAVVEVVCVPGRTAEVAGAPAGLPQVFGVHLTSGSADLYALVLAQAPPPE